jgi:hypothetical protein
MDVARIQAVFDRAAEASAPAKASPDPPGYSGCAGRVDPTPEWYRVRDLPRYDWHTDEGLEATIRDYTQALRTSQGTMELRAVQAAALASIHRYRGLLGFIGVGEGKTLITYLAPTVLQAKRPLLIVPAKLREKTRRDFRALLPHWKAHQGFRVISYEKLGRAKWADLLDRLAPDCIICDEAHRLKNKRAAVTRRVQRYLEQNEECAFVAMSGTLTSRSLKDFGHLALWALRDKCPLPRGPDELSRWARAVDEKCGQRVHPGVLSELVEEEVSLQTVRRGLAKRIHEAPGVINTPLGGIAASLILDGFTLDVPPRVEEHLKNLTVHFMAPNGEECTPSDVWRISRQLACGFYYRWDPEPPAAWLRARNAWNRFVRETLDRDLPDLDSEMRIAQAIDRAIDHGARPHGAEELLAWRRVRGIFTPNVVPTWLDDAPLRQILRRVPKSTPTLIWVEHVAVGQWFERQGIPYHHNQGMDAQGVYVEDRRGQTVALSIAANAEGRNLQTWEHNMIVSPQSSGRVMEQLLGRTHRPGQLADEVTGDVYIGNDKVYDGFLQSYADAIYQYAMTNSPQKLLLADLVGEISLLPAEARSEVQRRERKGKTER